MKPRCTTVEQHAYSSCVVYGYTVTNITSNQRETSSPAVLVIRNLHHIMKSTVILRHSIKLVPFEKN